MVSQTPVGPDQPHGAWLGEDSYLQVRKGAILLVPKHAAIGCEVLDAQLGGRGEGASEARARAGGMQPPSAFAGPTKPHLQADMVWP